MASSSKSTSMKFHEMGVDDRILEGIARLKWKDPTRVQEKAIPLMMSGKTVIAEARTGSGKTGAFLIPCLHKILTEKATAASQSVRLLVLAPTKELCRQISVMATQLTVACSREIRVLDLSPHLPLDHQRPLLQDLPDVVVGPPRRILAHVQEGNLSLDDLLSVVVDEADLMLAFHHTEAVTELWKHLPMYYQSFITSATLGKNMRYIKKFLTVNETNAKELGKNLVVLRLQEPPLPPSAQLTQYVIKLEEFDKAVLLYALHRLKLLSGKTIIFVNDIDKGYKLRMFLGQFGISTCILNSQLPANLRCDIIEQFNAGVYHTIIATDGLSTVEKSVDKKLENVESDPESGASRGLDFQFVANIINFDFPTTTTSYIHRVGRTARADNQGTALSMVSIEEQEIYNTISSDLSKLMEVSEASTSKSNYEGVFKKFVFDLDQLDGFSYRAQDVWRACTKHAIMKIRKREISRQLLNSKKLEVYFRTNVCDRVLLRHDKKQHGIRSHHHLKNVPEYNVPEKIMGITVPDLTEENATPTDVKKLIDSNKNFKRFRKSDKTIQKKKHLSKNQKRQKAFKSDPLKKGVFKGFDKSE